MYGNQRGRQRLPRDHPAGTRYAPRSIEIMRYKIMKQSLNKASNWLVFCCGTVISQSECLGDAYLKLLTLFKTGPVLM